MLTHYLWEDPDNASAYYHAGEYYTEEADAAVWLGEGAVALGLSGDVDLAHVDSLCRNRHPLTGKRVTQKDEPGRRVGYDFTGSLPKSASIMCLVMGDKRILDVLDSAMASTLKEMEKTMEVRVRKGGADFNRRTGKMVAAAFRHYLARPEAGWADPHLHKHGMIFNMTLDLDGKWRAGQFGQMLTQADYFEEVLDGHIARGLAALGYPVERRGKKLEIAAVPESIIRKFSRRTQHIEDLAKELGIRDPKMKGKLSITSRDGKDEGLAGDALQAKWRTELTDEEYELLAAAVAASQKGPVQPDLREARELLNFAVDHVFERASIVPEHRLLQAALKAGEGMIGVEDVKVALSESELIREEVDGETWVTTAKVLQEEFHNICYVKDGRGVLTPIDFAPEPDDQERLSDEQWQAVRHVLSSRDRVTAISGAPGSGKTTLMTAAIARIKASGRRVFTCAPSADASRGVLRAEGFDDADTLFKLLHDRQLQEDLTDQVVWVDEAGLIGATQMRQLFELANKKRFRIILSGDTGQHSPVPRGDALRLLETHAGLQPARVRTIRRQQSDGYREAVTKISSGDVANGFKELDDLGFIQEITTDDRHEALAQSYVSAVESGQSCLVVAPTHSEGAKVTALIRQELTRVGRLGNTEMLFRRLKNLNLTEAERGRPQNYAVGMTVQFHEDVPGKKFSRGDRAAVTAVSSDGVEVLIKGKPSQLPLQQAGKFTVYDEDRLQLAPGDRLRITRNGYSRNGQRLSNGALYTVKDFTKLGEIVLTNDMVLPPDFAHLSHGYCTTSMASQGKTVDHVLIAQSAESLGAASSLEQFNVSVSRGKYAVTIFTDDKVSLLEAVSKSSARKSAHDLLSVRRRDQILSRINRQRLNQRIESLKKSSRFLPQIETYPFPVVATVRESEPAIPEIEL